MDESVKAIAVKHCAPLPWRFYRLDDQWYVDDSNKSTVCEVWSDQGDIISRLIVAAPLLLEACAQAKEFLDNGSPIFPGSLAAKELADAVDAALGVTDQNAT